MDRRKPTETLPVIKELLEKHRDSLSKYENEYRRQLKLKTFEQVSDEFDAIGIKAKDFSVWLRATYTPEYDKKCNFLGFLLRSK